MFPDTINQAKADNLCRNPAYEYDRQNTSGRESWPLKRQDRSYDSKKFLDFVVHDMFRVRYLTKYN